jgi:hypothetical protein
MTLLLVASAVAACKKSEPPPPAAPPAPAAPVAPKEPPLPEIFCPPAAAFEPYLTDAGPPAPEDPAAKGKAKAKPAKAGKNEPSKNKVVAKRALRTSCTVFAPGRFWMAALFTYDEGTGANPRLALVSGAPSSPRWILFDVAPLPEPELAKLITSSAEVGVQVRRTRNDTALVRLGVTGGPGGGKPDFEEIGVLLGLVAHKPPRVLWIGAGDRVSTGADGCVSEQAVDFELLFRTRLERFNTGRVRPDASGKIPPSCRAEPSMQESVGMNPQQLNPGRPFGPGAEAATPKAP